jgi:hypothetical protein
MDDSTTRRLDDFATRLTALDKVGRVDLHGFDERLVGRFGDSGEDEPEQVQTKGYVPWYTRQGSRIGVGLTEGGRDGVSALLPRPVLLHLLSLLEC